MGIKTTTKEFPMYTSITINYIKSCLNLSPTTLYDDLE
jgi:hypothetical protein